MERPIERRRQSLKNADIVNFEFLQIVVDEGCLPPFSQCLARPLASLVWRTHQEHLSYIIASNTVKSAGISVNWKMKFKSIRISKICTQDFETEIIWNPKSFKHDIPLFQYSSSTPTFQPLNSLLSKTSKLYWIINEYLTSCHQLIRSRVNLTAMRRFIDFLLDVFERWFSNKMRVKFG